MDSSSSELNRSRVVYGRDTRLPFFKEVSVRPLSRDFPIDPVWAWESCGSKIITNGAIGAVGGIGLGLFMGAMSSDSSSGIQIIQGREVPMAPLREQVRSASKALVGKSIGWAKSFGVMTALFGGVECLIEKYR